MPPVKKKVSKKPSAVKKVKSTSPGKGSKKPSTGPKKTKKATAVTGTKGKAKKSLSKAPKATATTKRKGGVDFPEGSDMAVVWGEVLKGGSSRREVLDNCRAAFEGQTTSGGNEKPVSTILNQVLTRAEGAGYVIEQSWKVVPGPDVEDAKPSATPKKKTGKKALVKSGKSKVDVKVKKGKKPSATTKKVSKKKAR